MNREEQAAKISATVLQSDDESGREADSFKSEDFETSSHDARSNDSRNDEERENNFKNNNEEFEGDDEQD